MLDEATSALDRESEEAVLGGLKTLMQGRTVIMVSHKPERLLHVDRVIYMRGPCTEEIPVSERSPPSEI
jgi:ABC-type bacteriocin/lantibiotic exporter with double-glycine peptidase domain